MRRKTKNRFLVAALAVSGLWAGDGPAQEIFYFTDEAGRPVFSDRPPERGGAERMQLPAPVSGMQDPDRRLERINQTATLLKEDREAREKRRDERRREAARVARETQIAEAQARASRPVTTGIWYPAWRPPHGWWPGYGPLPGDRPGHGQGPGHGPGHRPGRPSRPPGDRPGRFPSSQLRAGPGGYGW